MATPLSFPDLNLLPAGGDTIAVKTEPTVDLPLIPLVPKPEPIDDLPITNPTSDVYADFLLVSERLCAEFARRMRACVAVPGEPSSSAAPSDDNSERAIVPVEKNAETAVDLPPPPPDEDSVRQRFSKHRSSEMVRVSVMSAEQERYFRDLVRRTRMVYESLRIFILQLELRGGGLVEELLGLPQKSRNHAHLKAATAMKVRGLWLNREQRIVGPIPGVYVGDQFFFRMEMCVVGLHGQIQAGIDYVGSARTPNGDPIATSIIVSGGYEDDEDTGDVIIYTGHGGRDKKLRVHSIDQKLAGGNLALERSQNYGIEIRVIRGTKCDRSPTGKVYIYDGLYKITEYWFDVGKAGFGVYKFKLVRLPEQPEMGTVMYRFARELKIQPSVVRPNGYLNIDMSQGKEKIPVYFYNDIDSDVSPLYFEYAVSPVYPPFAFSGNGLACDCVSSCTSDCKCVQWNGGDLVYDGSGVLLRGRPLIYECGTACSCYPSCSNRVSQKGLKHRLEVFRSRETTWGVRSLDTIRAGEFICEYSGLVLTNNQANVVAMNGENSLIYPSRFPCRWKEWGDLTPIIPDLLYPQFSYLPDFALDVSTQRNAACYISHSSSPNVMVQVVVYNQNNMFYPHLGLFSMENIPPLRELSIDYGLTEGPGECATEVLCIDEKSSGAQHVEGEQQ